MLALDEVITLLDDGIPLQVVPVMDVSDGADTLLAHTERALPPGAHSGGGPSAVEQV